MANICARIAEIRQHYPRTWRTFAGSLVVAACCVIAARLLGDNSWASGACIVGAFVSVLVPTPVAMFVDRRQAAQVGPQEATEVSELNV